MVGSHVQKGIDNTLDYAKQFLIAVNNDKRYAQRLTEHLARWEKSTESHGKETISNDDGEGCPSRPSFAAMLRARERLHPEQMNFELLAGLARSPLFW